MYDTIGSFGGVCSYLHLDVPKSICTSKGFFFFLRKKGERNLSAKIDRKQPFFPTFFFFFIPSRGLQSDLCVKING